MHRSSAAWLRALSALLVLVPAASCSIKRAAVNRLGDALSSGNSVYATDDDPEFVRDALPFGLKTIEGLLAQSPSHRGLLLSATSGFTQYAFVYLQYEADYAEDVDLSRATALRVRAAKMYRRALGYGLRGLEVAQPGWRDRYAKDPAAAMAGFEAADVPQLYWTAAAWGAAISAAKHDPELAADLPIVGALARRALALDPGWGEGTLHEFFISYDGGRPAAAGGSIDRARASFEKAKELARGRRASPFVTFAETVDVGTQNRAEFESLLAQALAVDPDADPAQRLANLVAQRRARWLLARKDQLFIE